MCLIFLFYFHLELGKDLFDFLFYLILIVSLVERKKFFLLFLLFIFYKENGYGMKGHHEFFC